jgi:hypothetical protein
MTGQELELIPAYPNSSWVGCALCLVIAVAVGAYRQWCICFWERIEILLPADDGYPSCEPIFRN